MSSATLARWTTSRCVTRPGLRARMAGEVVDGSGVLCGLAAADQLTGLNRAKRDLHTSTQYATPL